MNIFYFGLEPLKARYTYQLSQEWMPDTFQKYVDAGKANFIGVEGDFDPDQQIKIGAVLDAVGRGKFAMSQCSNFLDMLNADQVKDGDVIFLQDYWHPGIESILYALDLYGIKVRIYAMLHAQSVDEYDFTWPMRTWMRGFELGLDKRMSGIFVGSTIHRDQLRAAGFESPIHVLSLPLHKQKVLDVLPDFKYTDPREKKVIFSSRLDKEKNPFFMLAVAKKFLNTYTDWTWNVTTSGKSFKSMVPGVVEALEQYAKEEPRFKLLSNLTKEEYYTELATAKIQFNTSLQDYVSWTVLESVTFGCDVVFPDFRSFPEFIPDNRRYVPFDVYSAYQILGSSVKWFDLQNKNYKYSFPDIADLGRRMEAYIVINDVKEELNVWHEKEYCEFLLTTERIDNE